MRTRSKKLKEIAQLIDWGSEQCCKISDSPRLDAEILLTHSLNKPRSYCRTWPEKILTDNEIKTYQDLIFLRLKPTPVAYIIGYKEFWSRNFKVDSSTLIPRPDTELLVEKALDFLTRNTNQKSVLDLGTGSGCIAITLDLEYSNCSVTASDISFDALSMAKINAITHSSNITLLESSWFSQIANQKFDLIVSNPPYISQHDKHLSQGDLPAEPLTALASGKDGLDDIRLLTEQAPKFLNAKGMLIIEHGYDQKRLVLELFRKNRFINIQQYIDLNKLARLTTGVIK